MFFLRQEFLYAEYVLLKLLVLLICCHDLYRELSLLLSPLRRCRTGGDGVLLSRAIWIFLSLMLLHRNTTAYNIPCNMLPLLWCAVFTTAIFVSVAKVPPPSYLCYCCCC